MGYSDFTLRKAAQDFQLNVMQGKLLSDFQPISPVII